MGEYPEFVSRAQASVLSGELGDRLLGFVRQGYPPKRACKLAGVNYDTFVWWMQRGADPESRSKHTVPQDVRIEPYWSFARAVRAAQAEGRRLSPPGPRHGRLPSPIPPEAQAVILDGLSRGRSYHDATRLAGVRLSTFVSWLRLGGYPRRLQLTKPLDEQHITEPYKTFVRAVLAAEEAYLGQTG